MAAPKKKVIEKQISSDEKIRGLSLYFLQGRDVALEGLDWLEFLQNLASLSDVHKLARLTQLGLAYRTPKVSIRTITINQEDETVETNHVNVPLRHDPTHGFVMTIPDLYPHDGPAQYEICSTVHSAVSFTKAQHDEWDAFREEKGMNDLRSRIVQLSAEINQSVLTPDELEAEEKLLPKLEIARDALIQREADAFSDLEVSDDALAGIRARLELTVARMAEIKARAKQYLTDNDPFDMAKSLSPKGEELDQKNTEYEKGFLEFVHRMSMREGIMKETLETWLIGAKREDYANAQAWVSEGNASWTRGPESVPLSREELQRREFQKLLN